jgi:hypothetical protein
LHTLPSWHRPQPSSAVCDDVALNTLPNMYAIEMGSKHLHRRVDRVTLLSSDVGDDNDDDWGYYSVGNMVIASARGRV